MFSNIADSSKAGFIVADSTKSSALVVMSANLRNQFIFLRISFLDRSMVSLVSISKAKQFASSQTTAAFPKTSFSRSEERLWTGLVDARSVFFPCLAAHSAAVPAMTVLPTPPLPPKKMYFIRGWSFRYLVMLIVIWSTVILLGMESGFLR